MITTFKDVKVGDRVLLPCSSEGCHVLEFSGGTHRFEATIVGFAYGSPILGWKTESGAVVRGTSHPVKGNGDHYEGLIPCSPEFTWFSCSKNLDCECEILPYEPGAKFGAIALGAATILAALVASFVKQPSVAMPKARIAPPQTSEDLDIDVVWEEEQTEGYQVNGN